MLEAPLVAALGAAPVVAVLGSRQCGKTTLAQGIANSRYPGSVYLDLQLPSDRAKLANAELFLRPLADRLVVLDEIHRAPDLFPVLRGLVDQRRHPGRFLVLGSASPALLRQSSESLAGRIRYLELTPFVLPEVLGGNKERATRNLLWTRGGYPDSFLAPDDDESRAWRESFLRTFFERDVVDLGLNVSGTKLRRFFEMLAHCHGQLWNSSAFARNFDVSAPTVRHYLDLLTDAFVVRQLQPYFANVKKRLVKSPKVYLRDSGILHVLARIRDHDALLGHPILGASFEGFAIEQILALVPQGCDATFYRTHTGVELDLVLIPDSRRRFGIEIKYTSTPKMSPGLAQAVADVRCTETYVVTAGKGSFPLADRVTAIALEDFLRDVMPRLLRGT